jgi:argininosuccinate lyase
MVRDLLARGQDFADLDLAGWRAFSPLFEADVEAAVTPRASIEARRTPQSTAPAAVAARLETMRQWVERRTAGGA